MATRKEAVLAYGDAVKMGGATDIRLAMQTDNAMALAAELSEGELRFPVEVKASLDVMAALRETPEPEQFEEKINYYNSLDAVSKKFWEYFEGQQVGSVEIVRKR